MPVSMRPGDDIAGGTVSLDALFQVRATRTGADSTVAQIVDMVERAQARKKAPLQQQVTFVLEVYVCMCL
jgi:cation transport ATPase